jgi:iron complex outermembrane receptor protein
MKKEAVFITGLLFAFCIEVAGLQQTDYVINGRVSEENGTPLAGASVSILNTFLGAYTGAGGDYLIRLRDSGNVVIRYSYTGFEPVTRIVRVTGTSVIDVTLKPGTFLAGEVIVCATRASARTPVAYTNVDTETIRRQNNGQDLPFVLSLTPSLVETSESGTGIGYTGLRIRGTEGSRINVTVDGIPLNDAESQQVFWVDLPDLASSVENIQVQRGVGTSSNGAGAFGASINIQTGSPEKEPGAKISQSAGSFNTLKTMVSAGTGILSDRFAVGMRYSDLKSDGYIKRTGVDNRSAQVTGMYRYGRSSLKANVILGEEHTGISWWGVPAEKLETDRRYNPAGEYTDESGTTRYYDNESDNYFQNHYQLIYSLAMAGNTSLHAALHYTSGKGYYEEYREDQPYAEYGLPDLVINSATVTETDLVRRKWMGNDFYGLVYSLSARKGKLDAVIGGGMNTYSGRHYGKIIWSQYAGNVPKDFQWYLNRSRKGEASIYGRVNYGFTPNLSGFADIQYRYIAYRMNGIDDDLRDISQSHYFNFFNPKTGLFLEISGNMNSYLSFSVAGREPSRSDFKEASGDPDATPRPETLYDLEAGYNIMTGRAAFSINLFGMFYKDQLVPTGELSDVGYPVMTNVQESYRTGIEISTEIKPASRISWKSGITLSRNKIPGFRAYYLDYNTSDWSSEYKSVSLGTVDIAYSPSVTGFSEFTFNPLKNFNFHFVTKYVGRQYFDNTMNSSRSIDPYLLNNLIVGFNPALKGIKEVNLKLCINNIFNNMYVSNGYGGLWYEDGAQKTWAYYFPQAGMNFIINIELKF